VLVEDQETVRRRLATQRKEIASLLTTRGIGVGALVRIRKNYWEEGYVVGIVRDVDWRMADEISSVGLQIQWTSSGEYSKYHVDKREFDLSKEMKVPPNAPTAPYNAIEVLSPISEDLVMLTAPITWESGENFFQERYFPKGEQRQNWRFADWA